MSSFKLDIKGLDKVVSILNELPSKTQFAIQDEFKAVGDEWLTAARRDAPADRGRLKSSISKTDGYLTLEMSVQVAYGAYQEFGTKGKFRAPDVLGDYPAQFQGPGESGGVDPITALTGWVMRHNLATKYQTPLVKARFGHMVSRRSGLINAPKERSRKTKSELARQIAFAIFAKIKREGLKPQSFLFSAPDGSDRVTFYVNRLRTGIAEALKKIV